MKDLQKRNLVESLERLAVLPGWEVLREGALTATRSPAKVPLGNIVWGEATAGNLERGLAFFQGRPFSWFLEAGQGDGVLREAGFRALEATPEMTFDLGGRLRIWGPGIQVARAESAPDRRAWAEIFGEGFRLPPGEVLEYFEPLMDTPDHIPFLVFLGGIPAATSLLFLGTECAGIYAVSTRRAFRRMGAGQAGVQACLHRARAAGLKTAVLYSSAMGRPFYEGIGFTTVQVLREYGSPGYPVLYDS